MFYITVKQSPFYHQMTLEEFLFNKEIKSQMINPNLTNTRTYEVENISDVFKNTVDIPFLIGKLRQFNKNTEDLRSVVRRTLYSTFYVPKKSGGLRRIDAPNEDLMDALRRLKTIFENDFGALYHTSAFAYIKKRCTIDALKRHQSNESKWFGKFDLSNFFGSTTIDFVMRMFSMVFPFSEIIKDAEGERELRRALELAFLDGVLPQGTPISPLITNIMMIPVDFKLANGLREFGHQRYVYTRYADDFLVSSKYKFRYRAIEDFIVETLKAFDAPFTLNKEKTRYGSSAGSNWNLGLMLNKDNEITVGYQAKRRFQAMLYAFVEDSRKGHPWNKTDIQVMEGHRNYYRMVEKDTIDAMVEHVSKRMGVDVIKMIKDELAA